MTDYVITPVSSSSNSCIYYHYVAYKENLLADLTEILEEQVRDTIQSLLEGGYSSSGTRLKKICGLDTDIWTARVNKNDRLVLTFINYQGITTAYIHYSLLDKSSHKLDLQVNSKEIHDNETSFKKYIDEKKEELPLNISGYLEKAKELPDGIVTNSNIIEFTEAQKEGLITLLNTTNACLQIGWQGTGKTILLQTLMHERLESQDSKFSFGYIVSREQSLIPVLREQISQYSFSNEIEFRVFSYNDFIKHIFADDFNYHEVISNEKFNCWYKSYLSKKNNFIKSNVSIKTSGLKEKPPIINGEEDKKKILQAFSIFAGYSITDISNLHTGLDESQHDFACEMYGEYLTHLKLNKLIDFEQYSPSFESIQKFVERSRAQGSLLLGLEESQNLNARMWLNLIFVLCAQEGLEDPNFYAINTIQELKKLVAVDNRVGLLLRNTPLIMNYDPAQKIKTSGVLLPILQEILNPTTRLYTQNHRSPVHIQEFCLPLTETVNTLMLKTKTAEGVDTKLGREQHLSSLKAEFTGSENLKVFWTEKEGILSGLKFESGRWLVIAHERDKKKYEEILKYPVLSSEDVLSLESDYVLVIKPWNLDIFKTIAKALNYSEAWFKCLNEAERKDALFAYKILAIMFGRARKQLFIYQKHSGLESLLSPYLPNSTSDLPELDNSLLKPEALREKILRFIDNDKIEEARKIYNVTGAERYLQQTFEEMRASRVYLAPKNIEFIDNVIRKKTKKKKKKQEEIKIIDNTVSEKLIEKNYENREVSLNLAPSAESATEADDIKAKQDLEKFNKCEENKDKNLLNNSLDNKYKEYAQKLLDNFNYHNLELLFKKKDFAIKLFSFTDLVEVNGYNESNIKKCFLELILTKISARDVFYDYISRNQSSLNLMTNNFQNSLNDENLIFMLARLGELDFLKLIQDLHPDKDKDKDNIGYKSIFNTVLWYHGSFKIDKYPELFVSNFALNWYYSEDSRTKSLNLKINYYPNEIIKFVRMLTDFNFGVVQVFDKLLHSAIHENLELLNKPFDGYLIYPLHVLVAMNQYDMLEKFLSLGANPNVKTSDGVTPIALAVILYNVKIIDLLLAYSAEIYEAINSHSLLEYLSVFNDSDPEKIASKLLYNGVFIDLESDKNSYVQDIMRQQEDFRRYVINRNFILSILVDNCSFFLGCQNKILSKEVLYQKVYLKDKPVPKSLLEYFFEIDKFYDLLISDEKFSSNLMASNGYCHSIISGNSLEHKTFTKNILHFAFQYDRYTFISRYFSKNSTELEKVEEISFPEMQDTDCNNLTPLHYAILHQSSHSLNVIMLKLKFSKERLLSLINYTKSLEKTKTDKASIIMILNKGMDNTDPVNNHSSIQSLSSMSFLTKKSNGLSENGLQTITPTSQEAFKNFEKVDNKVNENKVEISLEKSYKF